MGEGSTVSDVESTSGHLCRSSRWGIGENFIPRNDVRCLCGDASARRWRRGWGGCIIRGWRAHGLFTIMSSLSSLSSLVSIVVPCFGAFFQSGCPHGCASLHCTKRARARLTASSFARAQCTMWVGSDVHSSRDSVDAPVHSRAAFLRSPRKGLGRVLPPK